LCSGAQQLLHSSTPDAPARSQCPRAGHSGFRHCTVQPGKYCTFPPGKTLRTFRSGPYRLSRRSGPTAAHLVFSAKRSPRATGKLRRFCGESLVVSSAKIQYLVDRLPCEWRGEVVRPRRPSSRIEPASNANSAEQRETLNFETMPVENRCVSGEAKILVAKRDSEQRRFADSRGYRVCVRTGLARCGGRLQSSIIENAIRAERATGLDSCGCSIHRSRRKTGMSA
jgi:hypothetical protein